MPDPQDRERLLELLRKESVRFGDFILASGQRSRVYVDAKLSTYRAAAMPLVGNLMLDKIQERGWFPDAVGGLSLGADPIAMAVARQSLERGREINCFIVRKEPKKHGLGRYIEGLESTAGLNVVIIDDVCTTGESTAIAIRRAREAGMRILGALCLVDREMGARANVETLGCPFDRIFTLAELTAGRETGASQAAANELPGRVSKHLTNCPQPHTERMRAKRPSSSS